MQCNIVKGFYARLNGEDLSLYIYIYIYIYMCVTRPHLVVLHRYTR